MTKRRRREVLSTDPCPCGAAASYGECCAMAHDDPSTAATAETVMRARYAAHVLGRTGYLQDSWHPETCPDTVALGEASQRWLGLEVRSVERGAALDAEGFVEFVATFKIGEVTRVLHERSRFVRLKGCWIYYDGELNP